MTGETYRTIAPILLAVGAITAGVFVVLYHTVAPWWRSAAGRHLMAFTGVLGATLTWGAVTIWVPTYPGRYIVGLVAYTLLDVLLVRRVWLLVAANRHRDDED